MKYDFHVGIFCLTFLLYGEGFGSKNSFGKSDFGTNTTCNITLTAKSKMASRGANIALDN